MKNVLLFFLFGILGFSAMEIHAQPFTVAINNLPPRPSMNFARQRPLLSV
jgi:hypothetical protein